MNFKNLFDEVLLQRNATLNDIFGNENLKDLSEEDKDELFVLVILDLLFRFGNNEYFDDPDEFLKDFLREKEYNENDEDEYDEYDEDEY